MSIKDIGRKIFNGLPIVSLIRYDTGVDSLKSTIGKLYSHMLYASIPVIYVVGSTLSGTPNPLGWRESSKERGREAQEYNQVYNEAVECVNAKLGFHPGTEQIELPRLKEGVLERIAKSCETEEGK